MVDIVIPVVSLDIQKLQSALDSIQSQTHQDWQAYVVSNLEIPTIIMSEYSSQFTWIQSSSSLITDLLNEGVTAGTNSQVTFLLPWHYWYDMHLSTIISSSLNDAPFAYTCFEAGEDYAIDYVGARYLNAQHLHTGTTELFYRDSPIPISNLLVTRSKFNYVNGFKNPMELNRDLTLRLCLSSPESPLFIDEITTYCLVQDVPTTLTEFEQLTYISDWTRANPTLINRSCPDSIPIHYWNWLLRLSGAGESKGRERVDCCDGIQNMRRVEAYNYYIEPPFAADNPDWQHLMTTEDEEWAFLEDL